MKGRDGQREIKSPRDASRTPLPFLAAAALLFVPPALSVEPPPAALQHAGAPEGETCLTCHFGIEEMHPWQPLSCTDCHGGDGAAETKDKAHVQPRRPLPGDERVLPLDFDPAYLRFKNPTNLRVLDRTCGTCHGRACADLAKSLHGTTAGHLCDGMYECGILPERGSRHAMFLTRFTGGDQPVDPARSLDLLLPLPSFDPRAPRDAFATHFADLPPKNCVRCHLYAPGVAVRGRLGLDGDYRSEGCAACHVTYADDGLSKSGDPTIDRFEPGHAIRHELTTAIPTSTCTHCHYGDASIGLNFRGLAQLYPGQPAGPEAPGTTDARLNQVFYQDDPALVPPDVHHERGMHCIDCHTVNDVMGDGNLHGQMPQAVEIECTDCHGTIDEPATLVTARGTRLDHLRWEAGRVVLTSKVTGAEHVVKQAAHVVSPRHPDFNPRAADAMTAHHARLECYTCHAGWSPNFFGFHFDRNEQFTQLDLMTGERTPGRVNTQEKVFATFRAFHMGWNSDGFVAPYMVGFSSMGTVHDADGNLVLDQEMPVTASGLSGMTLVHHQLHTTRPEARACADCHRNPAALGLGSPNANFRLGRNLLLAGTARGLEVLALDRRSLQDSTPLANFPMLGVRDVALVVEPLQGHARLAFLAVAHRGVCVVDVSNPAFPRQLAFVDLPDAHGVLAAGDRLYVAAGTAGVFTFDVADPAAPKLLANPRLSDARALALWWPQLVVADHADGLMLLDVTDASKPRFTSQFELAGEQGGPSEAQDVALLVIPSRPAPAAPAHAAGSEKAPAQAEPPRRTAMRVIAALACGRNGLAVVSITDPKKPYRYESYASVGGVGREGVSPSRVTAVAAGSKVDLGSPDGGIPTAENDYLYATVAAEQGDQARLVVLRVTDPLRPVRVATPRLGPGAAAVELLHLYNPPFLQDVALVAGGDLLEAYDVSRSGQPETLARFTGFLGARALAVEAMPLDRLVDETGRAWKDISHEGRFFSRQEIDKILRVAVPLAPIGPITGGNRDARRGGRTER